MWTGKPSVNGSVKAWLKKAHFSRRARERSFISIAKADSHNKMNINGKS
jgi:hypothetical protein